ncbi:CPBP family intramembrane glutamic endopeptidase [Priestia taiwanensis]|uniref:AbrB family transcriptional regulator n=1 Tax=Priestia taiwanensis TaxID=1347902 RepID=A0A917ESL4_9BACI|nr:type II CAAX endopeptidase family protein [Priestia taiwanensis]MBM7363675.1 membrane protease YdiL (CAAX protease family) [Priestia taiwanensis]GGE75014.1 AbrB family transcriptional regulator [Priestia taiwanensis]
MYNQFERIKIRYFLLTLFVSFMILGVISVSGATVMGGESTFDIIFDLGAYIVPFVWLFISCQKSNIEFRSFFTYPVKWQVTNMFIIVVMLMLFSAGVVLLQAYGLAYLLPDYVMASLEGENFENKEHPFMMLFDFLLIVILAPIVEEVIFRGFLLHRLSYKFGMVKAVIISSVLFGLFHFNLFGSITFALVCAILYIKTKNLLVPILAHMLNNFLAFMFAVIAEKVPITSDVTVADFQSLFIVGVGAVLTALGLLWLIPFLKNNWRYIKNGELLVLRTRKTPPINM